MATRALVATLLLSLLLVGYAADSFESASSANGRSLLKKKKGKGKNKPEETSVKAKVSVTKGKEIVKKGKEIVTKGKETKGKEVKSKASSAAAKAKAAKADAKREKAALAAHAKLLDRRAKEKDIILRNARKEAEVENGRFNKAATEEDQVKVFVNLWKNAKGPTILLLLKRLINSDKSKSGYYTEIVAESMLEAQRKGYSFQISDALANALTAVKKDDDGEPLLDAILVNMRGKNRGKKGSGCTYVKNLFTDAEQLAIQNGDELGFTRAIDDEEYIEIAECFYPECSGEAVACCKDDKAVLVGKCGCSKKEPNVCDFNLFLNEPRPIWRCSGEGCKTNKCLCPYIAPKKTKSKGGTKGKGKGKGKGRKA